jgi:hypothetical protein
MKSPRIKQQRRCELQKMNNNAQQVTSLPKQIQKSSLSLLYVTAC